jgi:peptide/nickel transport system permease protein
MSVLVEAPEVDWDGVLAAFPGRRRRGALRRALKWWPLAVLAVVAFVAAFPYLVAPQNPDVNNLGARLKGPGTVSAGVHYWLGTDSLGRDLLSRILWGARVSVVIAVCAVIVAGVVGAALGILSASGPRAIGAVVMRIADMVLSIPFFLLAILVATVLGPSLLHVVLVLALVRWPRYTRVAHAQAREAWNREFVRSAVALGARKRRVLARHILPEVLPSLIVVATLEVGLMVITEASLSFIGVGVQPPTPDWGSMLSEGQQYVATAWWIATFPGIAIFVIVLSVNRLGDLVRDRLDPRERMAAP